MSKKDEIKKMLELIDQYMTTARMKFIPSPTRKMFVEKARALQKKIDDLTGIKKENGGGNNNGKSNRTAS